MWRTKSANCSLFFQNDKETLLRWQSSPLEEGEQEGGERMENTTCPQCGAILASDAPAELCPKCLLGAGLGDLDPEQNDYATVIVDPNSALVREELPTQVDEPANVPALGTKVRYLGDYELIDEIARGGMGIVYKAKQLRLNRTVALKMILAGKFASPADVERFQVEAKATANLDHPGIVPIYEVGTHNGNHYFSMGFVDGDSLASKIASGPLPPRDAAQLVRKIADAVQYAHENGVIHRDLKPANILIDSNGEPKVTDFGLARKLEGDSSLTGTGQILGTPSYMPPEQARGVPDTVGKHSDIYSLGALLYHLLTGRPPFQGAGPLETLQHVVTRDAVVPRQLNPDIPKDLETICMKCLQKEPHRRYESAAELAEELNRYLDGKPILARPIAPFERLLKSAQRNRLTAALACLLTIGISLLLFPISTLDPQVLDAYAAVIKRSKMWFWLIGILALIYSLREVAIRVVWGFIKNSSSKSKSIREPRQTLEEFFWKVALGFSIGAPTLCLVMLIVQIIRLLQGQIL